MPARCTCAVWATGGPWSIVLDDLHWADEQDRWPSCAGSRRNRDVPLLSVMLMRPTVFEQHADWADGDDSHIRLDLKPLDKVVSRQLAETLLQRLAEVPAALRALVTDGAEGNPFYMEELVKMLDRRRRDRRRRRGWRVLPTSCSRRACRPR